MNINEISGTLKSIIKNTAEKLSGFERKIYTTTSYSSMYFCYFIVRLALRKLRQKALKPSGWYKTRRDKPKGWVVCMDAGIMLLKFHRNK